jgi:hypothetical protein
MPVCRSCTLSDMVSQSLTLQQTVDTISRIRRFSTPSSHPRDVGRCVHAVLVFVASFWVPKTASRKLTFVVQAIELKGRVQALAKLDGALWVSSPLTRAIETLLLSCPKAHLIGRRGQHDSTSVKVCRNGDTSARSLDMNIVAELT